MMSLTPIDTAFACGACVLLALWAASEHAWFRAFFFAALAVIYWSRSRHH